MLSAERWEGANMFMIGVDLGKRQSQCAVIDEGGKVLVERRLQYRREIVQRFHPVITSPRDRITWASPYIQRICLGEGNRAPA